MLFFGANKIPELARGIGKGIRYFKDATNEVQSEIKESMDQVKDDIDITKQRGKTNGDQD